jgi:cell division protein FtsW
LKNRQREKKQANAFQAWKLDMPLILALVTLVIFGLIMLYSASWDFSLLNYGDPTQMFFRQVFTLTVGLLAFVAAALFDYRHWKKLAVPLILIMIAGLSMVLIVGEVRFGSARAISEGSYMPGELAKVFTIIYLSAWLSSKRHILGEIGFGLLPLIGIVGSIAGLIIVQPDLSAAATIIVIGAILFFLAGGELKQIAYMLGGIFVLGLMLVQINSNWNFRLASFLQGLQNPTEASYHVLRSFEAFVSGGWFGVGIGQASTKLTGLPVPPTDSIFAVVGEETGIFGITLLIGLYLIVLWRGLRIANRSQNHFGVMLAAGIALWIGMEAFINMAVMVGLLPFAGNALPLISYGGSSLVSTLFALGILVNIGRLSEETDINKERLADATTRGRGGERRWGVSRARRAARTNQ